MGVSRLAALVPWVEASHRKPRAEAKACRKLIMRRIAALSDAEKADAGLIKATCRACGSCWLAGS